MRSGWRRRPGGSGPGTASWIVSSRSIRALSSRRYDSLALGRPVVGHRGDREERRLARVERPGRDEHRPAERAQERRRPADVERLVGEADEVAARDRTPRSGRSRRGRNRAAPRPGMLGRDGVEDAAHERAVVVRDGRRRGATSATGRRRAGPSRPGRRRTRARRRTGSAPAVSVVGAHRVAHLAGEQLGAEAALPLARGQDVVAQVRLEGGQGGPCRGRRRVQTRPDSGRRPGRRARLVRPRRGRRRSARRCPGSCSSAVSRLEPADRPAVAGTRRARPGAVEDRRHPLQPAGDARQPLGQRRELAGDEREQAVAQQVHPGRAGPRCRPGARLGEPLGLELLEDEVAIDRRRRSAASGDRQGRGTRRASWSTKASRASRPASVTSGQRSSWRWSPIDVAAVGLEGDELVEEGRKRSAKVVMDQVYGSTWTEATRRYHRDAMPTSAQSLGDPRHARRAARPAWSRSPSAISTTSRASPSTPRSGAGRSPRPMDDAGLRAWLEATPGQRRRRDRGPVRDDRSRRAAGPSAAAGS